jgi:hypothetical protein
VKLSDGIWSIDAKFEVSEEDEEDLTEVTEGSLLGLSRYNLGIFAEDEAFLYVQLNVREFICIAPATEPVRIYGDPQNLNDVPSVSRSLRDIHNLHVVQSSFERSQPEHREEPKAGKSTQNPDIEMFSTQADVALLRKANVSPKEIQPQSILLKNADFLRALNQQYSVQSTGEFLIC